MWTCHCSVGLRKNWSEPLFSVRPKAKDRPFQWLSTWIRHARPRPLGVVCVRRGLRAASTLAAVAIFTTLGTLLFRSGMHAQAPGPCDPPNGNAVVCENQLTGNPASEWDIDGAGDPSIQGFATDISVNRGQTIAFKIDTPATDYVLDIYRMGYYGGHGRSEDRNDHPVGHAAPDAARMPDRCGTGLIDCGNWDASASWLVPADATSGIYFAKVARTDTGGASHIVFVVRDDASHSDVLFQTSDTTWQAYNQYGGNSLYVGGPGTSPGRAYKVSYNRPFTTRGTSPEDWVFNAEYPMVRWLEANGYNVTYTSGVDTDRNGTSDPESQGVPVRRARRILVGRPARERRSGARRRRQSRVLQRQRGVLEDALGISHRHRTARRTGRWCRTRKPTRTPSIDPRSRSSGPAPGWTRGSVRRRTAADRRTR